MARGLRRITVKGGSDTIKPQRLRGHGLLHGGNIRHQQQRRVTGADLRDQHVQRYATGPFPGGRIQRNDLRGDRHQLIHFFERRGDEHLAVRIVSFDDADDRQ